MGRDKVRRDGVRGGAREGQAWREPAEAALRGEVRRRAALGEVVEDGEAVATLLEALAHWRREHGHAVEVGVEPRAVGASAYATLRARRMRCVECGAGAEGIYILCLPTGHVAALDGELEYHCATREELEAINVMCGNCNHMVRAGDLH